MVSNLKRMPGIVRLDPASEQTELAVTFNVDETTVEAIVAQLKDWDEQVTGWRVIE